MRQSLVRIPGRMAPAEVVLTASRVIAERNLKFSVSGVSLTYFEGSPANAEVEVSTLDGLPLSEVPQLSLPTGWVSTPVVMEGGVARFTLTYTGGVGTSTGFLRVHAEGAVVAIPVFSHVKKSPVLLFPASLDFGLVRVGDSVTLEIPLTNTGSSPYTLYYGVFSPGAISEFDLLVDHLVIAAGATAVVPVKFTPKAASRRVATVMVADGDSMHSITLSGSGVDDLGGTSPEITFVQPDTSLVLESMPPGLQYNVTFTNPYPTPYRVTGYSTTAQESVLHASEITGVVIPPMGILQVTVRHAPDLVFSISGVQL